VQFTIHGADSVNRRLTELLNSVPQKVAAALYAEASNILTEAQKRTPVEFGTLRASGHVVGPTTEGGNVSVIIAFGGPAAPYAVYVHENMEAHHNVGQAKYLESVIVESSPKLAARVAARVKL